jgi:hypothetical protein
MPAALLATPIAAPVAVMTSQGAARPQRIVAANAPVVRVGCVPMYETVRRESVAPPAAAPAASRDRGEERAPSPEGPRHSLDRLVDSAAGVMQRQVNDVAGVSNTLDLALKQAAYDGQNGFTPPCINGTLYAKGAADDWAFTALNKPTIAVRNDAEAQEFKASVTAVPANAVGYHMFLPTPPPWRTIVTLDQKRIYFYGIHREVAAEEARERRENPPAPMPPGSVELTTFKTSRGGAVLEVTGDPDPATLLDQVTRHETKHAVDIAARRDEIVKPWDLKLTQAKDAHTEYAGASDVTALETLWAAMGGTPESIAKKLNDDWAADSDAYHKSAAGKTLNDVRYAPEHIVAIVKLTA